MSLSVLTAAVGTAEHTCILLCCAVRVKQYLSISALLLDEPRGISKRAECHTSQLNRDINGSLMGGRSHVIAKSELRDPKDVICGEASCTRQKERDTIRSGF